MQKKILVTGGVGFLGTNLCWRLLSQGHHVIALDSFYTGTEKNRSLLATHENFSFVQADVTEKLPDLDVEEIYNLACPASPPHYQRDPLYTMRTSVLGAMNILDYAAATGAKVLQASTSEVYGDPEQHPQKETYHGVVNTVGIRSCYDEGKRAAETLFTDYHRHRGVNIRIMRIFNTYGPFMDPGDGRVVSNFICQALRGEDLTMYGNGMQTRSFCYVDDLIDGMVGLMNAPDSIVYPVNIGNPDEFTMLELAQLVLEKTESKSEVTFLPLPSDDPKQRCPDITRAKELLGWAPKTTLSEGLDRTIPWFRSLLGMASRADASRHTAKS